MPAERRKRVTRHEQVTSPEKRRFAVEDNAVEHLELGSHAESSGDQILASLNVTAQRKKKLKQQLRHETLLDRLGVSRAPYSKSHAKRLRRKAKEELTTDLAAIGEAITAVDAQGTSSRHPQKKMGTIAQWAEEKPINGQIGEGKTESPTSKQRKRMLQAERFRHKLIMGNKDFVANPFSTIRTHAKNTLEAHRR